MIKHYIGGAVKLVLLKFLALTSILPLHLCYIATDIIAIVAFMFMFNNRKAVRNNLVYILDKKPTQLDILKVFIEYGRYWAELPRVDKLWKNSTKKIYGSDFPPTENKFLGITFHIGNFEMFGSAIHQFLNTDLFVVAENLKPPFLAEHFCVCRKQHHIQTVHHNNLRQIIKVLKEGKPLGVVCDRLIEGNGVEVCLFGKSIRMPLNIVNFALQNGIPIFVAYCVKDSEGYKFHCHKIDIDTDFENAVKQIVSMIEIAIRNYPYQWHVLSAI